MIEYTKEQKKLRAIRRAVEVIYGHFEEGAVGIHSRIFEVLIADDQVEDGQSVRGGNYREHAVPCSLIRDECLKMYKNEKTVDEVAEMIFRHLRIVRITPEEAKYLDQGLGLKNRMPNGWRFGIDDPLARLHLAGIKLS